MTNIYNKDDEFCNINNYVVQGQYNHNNESFPNPIIISSNRLNNSYKQEINESFMNKNDSMSVQETNYQTYKNQQSCNNVNNIFQIEKGLCRNNKLENEIILLYEEIENELGLINEQRLLNNDLENQLSLLDEKVENRKFNYEKLEKETILLDKELENKELLLVEQIKKEQNILEEQRLLNEELENEARLLDEELEQELQVLSEEIQNEIRLRNEEIENEIQLLIKEIENEELSKGKNNDLYKEIEQTSNTEKLLGKKRARDDEILFNDNYENYSSNKKLIVSGESDISKYPGEKTEVMLNEKIVYIIKLPNGIIPND